MKKIIISKLSTIILLFVLICMQSTTWAIDTSNTQSVSRAQEFFSMPSVWIAIVGIIVCVGFAMMTGNKKDHIEV